VNLSALGNQVAHLHWHIIPRFDDDAHFPDRLGGPPRPCRSATPVDDARLGRRSSRATNPQAERSNSEFMPGLSIPA